MKYIFLVAAVLSLSACFGKDEGTPPGVIPVQIPSLPDNLSKKADQLPSIVDNTMGGMVVDGINTDRKYNEIAHQLNNLIDVYHCVRDNINKNDMKKCM